MRARDAAALVAFLALVAATAWVGGQFTSRSVSTWYEGLDKPPWTPSGAAIGAAWTVLYALMAVAAWLVWRKAGLAGARVPLALFLAQLVLNAGWSFVFFGLRRPGWALAELVAREAVVVATAVAFWRVVPLAGGLLVPCAAWVAFAGAPNAAIWWRSLGAVPEG